MHLAAEDNVLYPQMLKSTDAKARALAQRFVTEMHPISDAFKVLGERVRREHEELYSLADSWPIRLELEDCGSRGEIRSDSGYYCHPREYPRSRRP